MDYECFGPIKNLSNKLFGLLFMSDVAKSHVLPALDEHEIPSSQEAIEFESVLENVVPEPILGPRLNFEGVVGDITGMKNNTLLTVMLEH